MIVGLAIAFGVCCQYGQPANCRRTGTTPSPSPKFCSTDDAVHRGGRHLGWRPPGRRPRSCGADSAWHRRRRSLPAEPDAEGKRLARPSATSRSRIVAMSGFFSLQSQSDGCSRTYRRTPLDDRRPMRRVLFVLVIRLMVAAVCGTWPGLIGSSNNPISERGHSGGSAGRSALSRLRMDPTGVADSGPGGRPPVLPLHWSSAWRLFQRQSAGPQNRPTRRRYPMEVTGCTDHRRARRVGGDGADPAADTKLDSGSRRRQAQQQHINRPQARAVSALAREYLVARCWSLVGGRNL